MSGGIREAEARKVQQSDEEIAIVEITFTDEAANEFAEITQQHIGEQVEIYLNDNVITAL